MSPSDNDIVLTAYARFELITDALRSTESPAERSTLLSLALRSGSHPALEPFHKDPLLPLDGRFVSLDAQIAGLNALIRGQMEPPSAIGSIGATLYLPASQSAIACRVRTVYLPMQPTRRWDPPSAIHPVSDDLEASARKALEAALHLLLFVCPGETPPFPARIFWGVDEVSNSILEATSGDSLQLPLALAFLSALTRLPIAFDIGATGAIQSPDQVRSVRFTDEKRAIFLSHYGNAATFLTPSIGSNLREFALKIGDGWRRRFATPVTGKVFSLPPSVTPTFVYAEIENAPIFWASHASLFRDALPLYEKIFADSATRYGGKTFSAHAGNGEGLGAIFADPTQATDAAVHLLHCTRAVIWDSAFGDSLPVRIGVHLGEGEPSGDTWRGSGPALALRIAGAASAHQILASAAVHAAVKPAMDWIDHGKHRLRDLSDAVTLWEITAAGLQSINVPPESLDTRHHNLPAVSSPLIGRENEIDNILKHLATERLVTLTGAGGVGKTRLAFAVAARALLTPETTNRFPDGAFYISLDEESRFENALASAVCEAVGVTKLSSLSAKKLLLVLDNAEGAADIVARFVKSLWSIAPEIVLLVTSRIPIRLRGEKRVLVLPLDLPGDDSDEFEWKQASSVRLFLDRAQAGEENFTVTTQPERDALTGLLRRLDGLPLAIELAASRIRYLSIGEIESRLAESLRLLSTRDTDVPERHRTLLATLEWSYGLLSEPEQRLLSRVCEFVGGFGADAAEQVMGGDPDTLDLLASLEEQSMLVCRRADKGEPPRFSLLQTVTDFVRMKRQESGMDGDAARESHANYFTQLAERNGGEMMTLSAMETESFDALDREMANLRATWSYLRERKDTERQAKLAANLSDFLRRRGHARERSAWIEAALETTKEGDLGFRLTYAHAMTLRDTGQVIEAEKVAGALQPLVAETGNAVRLADVLSLRGTIATRAKCYNEAEQFFDEALTLYQSADDKRGIGTLHSNRAVNALRMAEMERARTLLEMALTVCDGIADEQGKAYAHNNLGYLLSEKGEYSAAKRHYLYQLGYCRRHSDTMGCAVSLFNIGEAFLYDGHGNGLPLLIAAAEIFSRVGHPYAESAWADCEKWAEKTDMPRGIFAALRRGASRRTLAELRGSLRDG